MRRGSLGVIVVVAILIGVGFATLGPKSGPKPRPAASPREKGGKQVLIRTSLPQRKDFSKTLRWFGTVKSRTQATLIALEAGRIVSLLVREGQVVHKGQSLFHLGGPLIEGRLAILKNETANLKGRIQLAEKNIQTIREALSQKFANLGDLRSAEDALARLQLQLASARQRWQQLQDAIQVPAAFDGVFTGRRVSVGQEVKRGDPLGRLIAMEDLYIEATVFFEGKGAALEKKELRVLLPGGASIKGEILTVLPAATPQGAYRVWVTSKDLPASLRPGQTVSGELILATQKQALAVPKGALVRDEEENSYVFVQTASGYRKQPVKVGERTEAWVQILSGLKPGERIVDKGAYELFFQDFNKMFKVVD